MRIFTRYCVVVLVCLLASGCGLDSNQSSQTSPPPSEPAATKLEITRTSTPYYADILEIDANVPEGVTIKEIVKFSGLIDATVVGDKQFRIATPSDPYTMQEFDAKGIAAPRAEIEFIGSDGKHYKQPIQLESKRPTTFMTFFDAPESGPPIEITDTIQVTGLVGPNLLRKNGGELRFKLVGLPPFEMDKDYNFSFLDGHDFSHYLGSTQVQWDATTQTFVISAEEANKLYDALPDYPVSAGVDYSSVPAIYPEDATAEEIDDNAGVYRSFSYNIAKAQATLKGKVVDATGAPATALAGRKVAVIGYSSGVREVLTLGADASFTLPYAPADTYEISIVDVHKPKLVSGFAYVRADDTQVDFVLDARVLLPESASEVAAISQSPQVFTGSSSKGNAPQRAQTQAQRGLLRSRTVKPLGILANCKVGTNTYRVISASENDVQQCNFKHLIPKGTAQIEVATSAATEEFPEFTGSQSQFNDSWSYALTGLPVGVSFQASGKVNDTHRTVGDIRNKRCVNVAALTKDADASITGVIKSVNIGDSALDTVVAVSFELGCNSLVIDKAEFGTTSSNGYGVIKPKSVSEKGNQNGRYISVPTSSAQSAWGFPLTVNYSPATASITELQLSFVRGGTTIPLGNFIAEANKSAGTLKIANFKMPQLNTPVNNTPFQIKAELKGTLAGQTAVVATDPVWVFADGGDVFTPLFLANDNANLAARRYGSRDTGGDSWVQAEAFQWLLGALYRFDDVSALHIAQSGIRSAIDHAGHSDGSQIDLRYSDAAGGYSETLGGAQNGSAIKALALAAQKEVAQNTAAKPKLATLQRWIGDNRRMIEREAPRARWIYFGPDWMKNLLQFGKFTDGKAIPDVGAWTNKPVNSSAVAPHLHHWHMTLKVPRN